MATLVTGGTGFVGSNIVKALAQRGHDVVCLDLVAPDALVRKFVEPWADQVTFVQGDILSKRDLERATSSHEVTKIVHAAVFTGQRPDIEKHQSRSIVDINVVGTANLLDLAAGLPLDRFLYVSTRAVYGEDHNSGEVLQEDGPLLPRSLYATTKYFSELVTRRYGELHGFPSVSVRLSSPYGPMERVTGHRAGMSLLYEWTGSAVRGEPIRVGDRTLGRDYTYVADTAAGVCTVLDAPALSHDVYNISAGRWITLEEIIRALQEARPALRVVDDAAPESGSALPGAERRVLDTSRLQGELGFTAGFDVKAGIRDYLEWREEFTFRD